MQVTQINNSYNTNQNRVNNAQNVQFKANFSRIFPKVKAREDFINTFLGDIQHYLGITEDVAKKYVDKKRPHRMNLFYNMAKKLNDESFQRRTPLPENKVEIMDGVFDAIRTPEIFHRSVIESSRYSFADSAKILQLSAKSPENLEMLRQLTKLKNAHSQNINLNAEELTQIVNLPNAQKLSSDFDTYKSYIILNRENPDFIEQLGKELSLETPSFNVKELDETVRIRTAQSRVSSLQTVPDEVFRGNLSESGLELFETNAYANSNILHDPKNLGEEDFNFVGYLLRTTTKDNVDRRKSFFREFMGVQTEGNSYGAIAAFFDRMDNDQNYTKIFDNIFEKRTFTTRPISELMYYVDSLGSDVVAKNQKNFVRIVRANHYEKMEPDSTLKALQKDIKNKFYLSPTEKSNLEDHEDYMRYSFFGNTKVMLFRAKNKFKYDILPRIFGKPKEIPLKTNVDYETYCSQFDTLPTVTKEMKEINGITEIKETARPTITIVVPAENGIVFESEKTISPRKKLPIRRETSPRKLRIQGEALEIIRSRMKSTKQIAEQSRDYSLKATKMRNKYLNRIFDHIAQTRSQQRKAGIKRPTVSNEDALRTYQFINGKNKKIFLEMLKARDEQGNLIYDINQIGDRLDEFNIEQNLLKLQKTKSYQKMKAKELERERNRIALIA